MSNAARLYDLLKRPIVTEKSTSMMDENKYIFEVDCNANKVELKQAFEKLYPGRKVLRLQTTVIPPQQKRMGRRMSHTAKSKKAIFTIEGEGLELFAGV